MASREKKLSTVRKQASASSPIPPQETVASADAPSKQRIAKTDSIYEFDLPGGKAIALKAAKNVAPRNATVLAKRITKNVAKKTPLKKNLVLNPKNKDVTAKFKQDLAQVKAIIKRAIKKPARLRNGVKPQRIRSNKARLEAERLLKEQDDSPPVLEPMLPLQPIVEKKPPAKKRVRKVPVAGDETAKKMKTEANLSSIDDTINSILSQIMAEEEQKITKKPRTRKPKVEVPVRDTVSETIEDVMKDLSYLIKSEEILAASEPIKTEDVKIKKAATRRTKGDMSKKKLVKKENNENVLNQNINFDASAKQLIDMLDLSVGKAVQITPPVSHRRHSIEKFPLMVENTDSVFSSLPRSLTPRSKRASRSRQSADSRLCLRRYSTRSDSPAQILRNGKHRKMKDSTLLEGLDIVKRRRRLCSEFSGSERSVSKLSGYESDSSVSDKAFSVYGTDNLIDQKDGPYKCELVKKELIQNTNSSNIDVLNDKSDSIKFSNIVKRSFSTETLNEIPQDDVKSDQNLTDSNSNLCNNDIKSEVLDACEPNKDECAEAGDENPSSKVPEKSIILDIMKQAFNDITQEERERRTTRSVAKRSFQLDEDKLSQNFAVSTEAFYGTQSETVADQSAIVDDESQQTEARMECQESEADSHQSIKDEPPILEQIGEIEQSENSDDRIVEKPDLIMESATNTDDPSNCEGNLTFENNKSEIAETPENLAIKENILQALGLQSLKAAEEAKLRGKVMGKSDYTGTLKIKVNRYEKKKGRNLYKISLQKGPLKELCSSDKDGETEFLEGEDENGIKNSKESSSIIWRSQTAQSSDTAGAIRKSHYSNRSNNMDGSSEHTSDGDTPTADGEDGGKILVIPEKASSFSIHPGRLCKDECSYCFGKFGLFDTPCHIAQMKSVEKQDKILETEKHLTRDSCLCDACYRHVDRKSNTPSYLNKGSKRSSMVAPGPRQNHCHVLGCGSIATNILRRKWIIKMRKSVCQVINIDLDNPGLHSIPICDGHYAALEHLMICAMCKRRLARNHIHYLGPEMNDLNTALNEEGIPVKLMDKPVVCKLCRYFASLILKPTEERPENTNGFFTEYKKRLLHFHDVEIMDDAAADEPIPVPAKEKLEKEPTKRKKKLNKSANSPPLLEPQVDLDKHDQSRVPSDSNSTNKSRSESPSDYMVDYHTLIPSIAMECGSDIEGPKRDLPALSRMGQKVSRPESIKEAVEISKSIKLKNNCDNISKNSANAVQRLGSNPCISVRQLFPGEEELSLQGNIDFGNIKEKTPEGWEKCTTTIQYDSDTKLLWQELQKPYGNHSSFLRHLILLEKYFRSGDLILSPHASHHSVNYSESVQNRLHAYDNIPNNPYAQQSPFTVKKSMSGIITTKDTTSNSVSIINAANIPKNTPITLSQINNLNPTTVNKTRNPGVPPGLISIHSGTPRPPITSLIKVPQPQKIKIPLTKNWRPTLIPIDPNKKSDKRPGYVKVISGGKPYHITIEDYNRMCAIKKSYDLKQKRLMDAQAALNSPLVNPNSMLKSMTPRKGLTISSKTATITSPNKSDLEGFEGSESNLEKLDRTVENLESKLAESTNSLMNLPKIPKSLTVIPQTVSHRPSQPSSPSLLITPRPKPSTSKS